jgi:hypothetical protein
MAEDWNVNFPAGGLIDHKIAGIDCLQGCMKRQKKPYALQARKYKSSGSMCLLQQRYWNLSIIISVYLNLGNLLLIECITFMKPEYLQLYGLLTLLLSLGRKQVGQAASGERGTMIVLCMIIISVGNTVPQAFIFPRTRLHSSLILIHHLEAWG